MSLKNKYQRKFAQTVAAPCVVNNNKNAGYCALSDDSVEKLNIKITAANNGKFNENLTSMALYGVA